MPRLLTVPILMAGLCLTAALSLGARSLSPRGQLEGLCGPLCLTFCARWLGADADVEQVAAAAGADPAEGTSLAGLANAAATLGLEARACRLRLNDLRRVTSATPAIVHVDQDHFAVAWMGGPEEVTVVRPLLGVSRMALRSFGRRWDGAALVVSLPGKQPSFGWPPLARLALGAEAAAMLALILALAGQRRPAATRLR